MPRSADYHAYLDWLETLPQGDRADAAPPPRKQAKRSPVVRGLRRARLGVAVAFAAIGEFLRAGVAVRRAAAR